MAGEDDVQQDDTLDLTDEQRIDAPGDDDASAGDDAGDDAGEEYPTFDGDPGEDEQETDLVKHLRRENRELHKKLSGASTRREAEEPIVVGNRPKLEDFDYDSEAHDKALDEYEERKEAKRQQDMRLEQARNREAETWRQVQEKHQTKWAALPYQDKAEAQRVVGETLSESQRALIADVCDDPGLFEYGLFKNPLRMSQIAAFDMSDPRQVVKLAATVGRMGAGLTVKKKAKAPPVQAVTRGGTARQGADKELERLEKEADRTGNRTALIQYRKAMKNA